MRHTLLFLFLFFASYSFAQNKNKSIGFKENKGQIIDQKGKPNPEVKYLLNTNGLNVQIKTNGFSYDIYETKKHPLSEKQKAKLKPTTFSEREKNNTPDYSLEYIYHRIDIDFVNSNPKVELITEQKSKDYDNYYNVPNKPDGVLMVHQYKQITYKNIYPNIDVVFSIPKDSLKAVEYNFVVHPKGKISDIQLKFNGAKTELVDNKIKMQVRFGEMEETLPMSWTEDGKRKKEIAVGYTKIKNNVYGFASAENVSGKTVVIDPVPMRLWGTFYGDQTGDHFALTPSAITTDSSGNSYTSGSSSAFNSSYATTGAHQTAIPTSFHYVLNGIIEKFGKNGNRLWGTYYGGIDINVITDIKTDNHNNVFITGLTEAQSNISTFGSYQPNLAGGDDAFLVKFNNLGIRLWGTYFGGEFYDSASSLDIDKNDNIYIVGTTSSKTNIAFKSNFQTQLNQVQGIFDNYDGFLAKFDNGGNLIWSTYVGGESADALSAIVVKDNYLITGGYTKSFKNISTSGVFQEKHDPITHPDGVVYKFSLDGQRIWATYYGGEQVDYVYTVEADDEENIYLGGETASNTNITTPNSFDSSNTYSYKGFFAKLNSKGVRIWGSYLGQAHIYSLIFKNNSIYIGATNSGFNNPKLTNLCSYRSSANFEGYIGKFSKQSDIIWGTFIGSDSNSKPTKIKLDFENNILVSGISSQNNGIADSNSYQSSVLGFWNYFLMKFSENSLSQPNTSSNSPICIGNTLELKASGGTAYAWTGPNGFTSTDQNPIITNASAINAGKYSCNVTGTSGCDGVVTVDVIVGDNQPPVPDSATLPTITGDCNTIIKTIPTATDVCAGAVTATTTSQLSYSLPGTYTVIWNYNDGNGNSINQNQTVTISSPPLPTTTSPQTFCIQQNTTLNSIVITGQNIKWYNALTNGSLLANSTLLQNGITYYASQTINGCESERTPVLINIQNTVAPIAISPQTFCASQNPTLSNLAITGTTIKWYDSITVVNILPDTTPLQNGQTYYATQTINDCESTKRSAITVALISTLPAKNFEELFCDDLNDGKETVDLSNYNSSVISNTTGYNFTYYKSIIGAENETTSDKITNFSNYKLVVGDNKIYVRINSNTPCYAVVELKLTLFSKPIINIQDIVPICENNSITIDAGPGFDHYLWSNGATTRTISVTNPGNFSITVTDDYDTISCSSTKHFTVKKSNKATIKTIETKDWTDNENTIAVFATGDGEYEYSIDGYNYQTSNQFTGLISGKYTIKVRDKNGCGTATDEVYLLMFPKFFTPNGDGYNDTWKIKFSDIELSISIKIYDRYGKLIKNLSTNTDSWDGTYSGNNLPATDYWFVVTKANGQEYKGHFSLKR
jgi:gliding motility-associated-like protein